MANFTCLWRWFCLTNPPNHSWWGRWGFKWDYPPKNGGRWLRTNQQGWFIARTRGETKTKQFSDTPKADGWTLGIYCHILWEHMGKYGKYGKIWECIHLVSHNFPIRYKYIPLVLLAKLCYPSQIHVRLGVRDTGIDVVRDKHAKWPGYIDGIICIVYIYIHVYIPKMI